MKDVETLLIEIKKPVGDPKLAYRRLRALTRSVAQALNMTMQDSHPHAVAQLRAQWDGDSKQVREASGDWRTRVRTVLAHNWNARLERERLDRAASEPDAELVYAGINGSALAEETATNITSQFNGQNVKELIALRKGFPEFGISSSFYCGGRFCSIAGTLKETRRGEYSSKEEAEEAARQDSGCFVRRSKDKWQVVHEDSARISLPLWGTGKKVTEFIIGPAGGHARATWRQLVAHFDRREEIVQAEADLDKIHRTDTEKAAIASLKAEKKNEKDREKRQEIDRKILALIEASNKRMQLLRDPIEAKLYGLTKIGRIGVVWKERRRKWFVTVSYTRYVPPSNTQGQAAAVNFGINNFLQAFAVDESTFSIDGSQILHKRFAFYSARKRIQKSIRHFGKGSRGRGVKRRELPLLKRQGDEHNWTLTYIRDVVASDLIKWCKSKNVSDLYLEDLGGIREEFEQETEGQAHAEVKRRIHSWPYGETRMAIVREGVQHGIRVHTKGARFVSQRCPSCGFTDPQNVQEVTIPGPVLSLQELGKGLWKEVSYVRPKPPHALYRRQDKTYRFECGHCGMRGQTDIVACLNHLQDIGAVPKPGNDGAVVTPLSKMQERARKAITNDKRKKIRRTGK